MKKNKKTANIPLSRLILYAAIIVFLPFLFISMYFFKQGKEWDAIFNQIVYVKNASLAKTKRQATNTLVRELYKDTDPLYLASQLESLTLLKKEKEALEFLMRTPAFTGNEMTEQRYHFLARGKNKLQLSEISSQAAEGVTETIETLTHPVEIDSQDLKEILFRIEGNRVAKPFMLFTDFKLAKKEQPWGSEVFELNFKILKREFLK